MNYEEIKKGLSSYDSEKVSMFCAYLKELELSKKRDGTLSNPWFRHFTKEQAIEIYKKVAMDNLFIDGSTITLSNRGKVIVTYNFQAYKNKLLNVYPESKFDIQLVRSEDSFSFEKVSGKVEYLHKIKNPFSTTSKIIGVYCIIKNSRGEFLETLDMAEIEKMKAVATTKNIWKDWEGEMIIKSVIKRACKRHFNDLVVNIETLDNENYELENVSVEVDYQDLIEKAKTESELVGIYTSASIEQKNNPDFVRMLQEKKHDLLSDLPTKIGISEKDFPNALSQVKKGKLTFEFLNEKYHLTPDQLKQLEDVK